MTKVVAKQIEQKHSVLRAKCGSVVGVQGSLVLCADGSLKNERTPLSIMSCDTDRKLPGSRTRLWIPYSSLFLVMQK